MVDAKELMISLHIDQDPEEVETINGLIETSIDIVKSSVNYQLDDSEYAKYPMFDSAVKALTTALYYDRTLDNGIPKAVKMMIIHLQGRLGGK